MTRPPAECSPSGRGKLLCPHQYQQVILRALADTPGRPALIGLLVHEVAGKYIAQCNRKATTKLRWFGSQRNPGFINILDACYKDFIAAHPEWAEDEFFAQEVFEKCAALYNGLKLPKSKPGKRWRHIPEQRIIIPWPLTDPIRTVDPAEVENSAGRIDRTKLTCDVLSGKPDSLSICGEEAWLIDFKSGHYVAGFGDARRNEQLRFYAALVMLKHPEIQKVTVVIWGLIFRPENRNYHTYGREIVEWALNEAGRFFATLDALHSIYGDDDWPIPPDDNWTANCTHCPVGKALNCPKQQELLGELGILEAIA